MANSSRLGGGCLCGAIRYEVDAADGIVDLCHCRDCRRASGGIAVAWLQVRPERFRLVSGTPASYLSSPKGRRHFCPRCGAQVAMTDPNGRSTGVTVATLDDPEAVHPDAHGWDRQRPSWLRLDDELPRFAEDPPYDRGAGSAGDDAAAKTALDSEERPA